LCHFLLKLARLKNSVKNVSHKARPKSRESPRAVQSLTKLASRCTNEYYMVENAVPYNLSYKTTVLSPRPVDDGFQACNENWNKIGLKYSEKSRSYPSGGLSSQPRFNCV
jgi:hypothetical protein